LGRTPTGKSAELSQKLGEGKINKMIMHKWKILNVLSEFIELVE
jgi:hypothetical protein